MTASERDILNEDLRRLQTIGDEALLGHIQAEHLIAYAEERGDPQSTGFIRDHLSQCMVCNDALQTYRRTIADADETMEAAPEKRPGHNPWDFLRRSILGPAPALAYLALLLVTAGWLWNQPASTPISEWAAEPSIVSLFADDALSGGTGTKSRETVLDFTTGRSLLLLVHSELIPEDLSGPIRLQVTGLAAPPIIKDITAETLPVNGIIPVLLPASLLQDQLQLDVTIEGDGILPFSASFRLEEDGV